MGGSFSKLKNQADLKQMDFIYRLNPDYAPKLIYKKMKPDGLLLFLGAFEFPFHDTIT